MLRFACFWRRPRTPKTVLYEYVVEDRLRHRRWSREVEVHEAELLDRVVNVREWKDIHALRRLWREVERDSLDTFTDAKALGWFDPPPPATFADPDGPPPPHRYHPHCSWCIKSAPSFETEAEGRAALIEAGWQFPASPNPLLWCVDCSRKAHEVPFHPLDRRARTHPQKRSRRR